MSKPKKPARKPPRSRKVVKVKATKATKRETSKPKPKPKPKTIVAFVDPVEPRIITSRGGVCACGDPVAAGQTYVCKKHIRAN